MEYYTIIFYSPYGMSIPKVVHNLDEISPEVTKLVKFYKEPPTMIEIGIGNTKDIQ